MVRTRGQQPIVAVKTTPLEKVTSSGLATGLESSNHHVLHDDEVETIGSRLRKRRRTGSSPIDETSPASKRPSRRNTLTPDRKSAQNAALSRAASTTKVPVMNGGAETSPDPILQLHDIALAPTPAAASSELIPQDKGQLATMSVAPDLAAVIERIINHGDVVKEHLRNGSYDEMGPVNVENSDHLDASLQLKIQSLPILDNLARQILGTLAKCTYQEILTIATDPDSEPGSIYATLRHLFDQAKKVYHIHDAFLSPYELGLVQQAHVETIRMTNLATFVSSVFGSQEVGFFHLNEYFLDTFVADGSRLLKNQAQLYLDLKTQAFISALSNGERSREELLEDLFPTNLEERLLSRRPGAKQLAPSEADFLNRARNRSKTLLEESATGDPFTKLPDKYVWEDFLRDISGYVSKTLPTITGTSARKPGRPSNFFVKDQQQHQSNLQDQHFQQKHQSQQTPQQIQHQDYVRPTTEVNFQENGQEHVNTNDIAEKAARAARFAMQDFDMNQESAAQNQQDVSNQPQLQYLEQRAPSQYYHQGQVGHPVMNQQFYGDQAVMPFDQTAPTQVLYERARMAASAKASPSNRRAGVPSQRRQWSMEEEGALMAGLDLVKGPHWSQILAMFGPGGTVNETLKDRTQVQLKDKARNLKLFFLKNETEVPYYLQFVTGELKTRAPAQAAKHEAKEREKRSEDRAHIEGVMTLVGGVMQDSDQVIDGIEFATSTLNGEEDAIATSDGGRRIPEVQDQPEQLYTEREVPANAELDFEKELSAALQVDGAMNTTNDIMKAEEAMAV